MALDQPGLFDEGGISATTPEEIRITLDDGPLARPARVGFLAGMLALWIYDGKPSPTQKERLKDIARETLLRAQEGATR